jgi:hypothetical protein
LVRASDVLENQKNTILLIPSTKIDLDAPLRVESSEAGSSMNTGQEIRNSISGGNKYG